MSQMTMYRWSIIFVLIIGLVLPFAIQAQETPTFTSLEIDLWPEFDQPAVLVIYKAELSPRNSFPVSLTFRIPVQAGVPSAVAVGQSDESLFNVAYQRTVKGEWVFIHFQASMPVVRLEYYDPRIKREGNQHAFEFIWPGDYPAEQAFIQIQKPFGAQDLKITPEMAEYLTSSDGVLEYYDGELGALAIGEKVSISVSYTKASDALSIEAAQARPVEPITPNTPGRLVWWSSPWVWGLAGILIVIIGFGIWYWAFRQRIRPFDRNSKRQRIALKSKGETGDGRKDEIYCHQCGKRALPGDRFCRLCGTRLRVPR